MTAMTTLPATAPSPGFSRNRILAVTRLHFVNRFAMFVLPSMILGFILLANIAIWYLILAATDPSDPVHHGQGFSYTGAIFYIFIYMMIVAVQAVNRTFPFALGYGVTRRNFWLGSSLAFVLLAVGYSALLTILSVIELWTNGWGAGGHMFVPTYFDGGAWYLRFALYLLVFLLCLFVGSAAAAVYVRWRSTGMIAYFAGLVIIVLGAITLITLTGSWVAVGDWLTDSGALGLAAWSLVISAVSAFAGYFILRRATPKN
jgi:hypothetical protein